MARILSYLDAIGEALAQEMRRDPAVVVFGEDNIGGTGTDGKLGNAWGPTKGLNEMFPDQIFDAPITEAAFVGAAVGAAATGLRPVADLLFVDFAGVCFDQILNQAAKLRYMVGGKASVPLVLRAMWGAGMRRGAQHSQALYPIFTHIPGLKVVVPSTPADAKGLMTTAIRDNDPVVFFEHKMLYFSRGVVPEESYEIPFGQARTVREGTDCTIVAIGRMVGEAEVAAEQLAMDGMSCEVIDPRTVSPLDTESIYASVRRTGRLVVVDESNPRCSVASDIASLVAQNTFDSLRGPVQMVTSPHAPTPFSPALEDAYAPNSGQIVSAVQRTVRSAVPA
ncbi:alpha-ketoacid dehydrogenase subunit beta [Kibdelosporangium phytohabitans]|uniref:Pyruvate dehydrogenase n=1 Tax=Kibdelosporangium phytohabitans TaxID=860235 RepID=A0A0N9I355_9PSEU|nr:alpha-ketoacid dehydrogenase subunit beta [Kibdelosporangium phytohabitans]ALG08676.1 pyruvate dehydrogenase [Kibdelosporangium phytohabitans]MBE1470221.1 pyruvate dehydrogenase E1 component beta subunit [Kibdelosporangium phytohabitans]